MSFDVINGSADPGSGIGANGDFFLNTVDMKIFGPKASGSWPAGVSLVGPAGPTGAAGAAGANGSTVRNGAGVPSGGLGVDGDFYIDSTAHRIYGPKISGAWGSGVSLIGPAGTNGTDGTDGMTGATGAKGDKGDPGTIARSTVPLTTGSLANGAVESGTVALGKSWALLKITTTKHARVRLYSTTAARDTDVARPANTPPAVGTQHGVIADIVMDSVTSWIMAPVAYGADMAGSPTGAIGYTITNLDTTGANTVTFTIVNMES